MNQLIRSWEKNLKNIQAAFELKTFAILLQNFLSRSYKATESWSVASFVYTREAMNIHYFRCPILSG